MKCNDQTKYNPKYLLIFAVIICAFSTFLFSNMANLTVGFISRVLMGFGASFAFVGTLKLISLKFNAKRFAFLAGLTQTFGMLGAMLGQGPLGFLYSYFGWRNIMLIFAIIFILIMVLMSIFIKMKIL